MLKSRGSTVAGRGVALTTAAAFVLAVAAPQAVQAQPLAKAPVAQTDTAKAATGDATDFSSQRRRGHRAHRGYRNNNAAGLAFMGLALGTIGAVIANQQRRDYYRQNYYYGGSPYYGGHYYGNPGYYGSGYYNPY